ncbi:hypothetical protein SY88_19945 [Clostridiales bacterium PH28_bin88]|nr:hypothetical protein SY88_19945 [Clostridiales bacterium PH28_bin88]
MHTTSAHLIPLFVWDGVVTISPAVFGEEFDSITCPLKIVIGSEDKYEKDMDLRMRTVVPCERHLNLHATEASFSVIDGLTHILSSSEMSSQDPVLDPRAYQEAVKWIEGQLTVGNAPVN